MTSIHISPLPRISCNFNTTNLHALLKPLNQVGPTISTHSKENESGIDAGASHETHTSFSQLVTFSGDHVPMSNNASTLTLDPQFGSQFLVQLKTEYDNIIIPISIVNHQLQLLLMECIHKHVPTFNEEMNINFNGLELQLPPEICDLLEGREDCLTSCHILKVNPFEYALQRIVFTLSDGCPLAKNLLLVQRNQWIQLNQKYVIMDNDIILPSKVVDMIPFTFGFITKQTEILFMDSSNNNNQVKLEANILTPLKPADSHICNLEAVLNQVVNSEMNMESEIYNKLVDDSIIGNMSQATGKIELHLDSEECFDTKYIQKLELFLPLQVMKLPDIHNYIFISPETSIQCNMRHNQWGRLVVQRDNGCNQIREVIICVSERFSHLPCDHFACTNILEYNIRRMLDFTPSQSHTQLIKCIWEGISELGSIYSFATQCILSVVQSPNHFSDHEHKCSQYSFNEHFKSNRGQYLLEGDIICVNRAMNATSYPDEDISDLLYFDELHSDEYYFIVKKLIDGNFVKNDITSLIVQGNVSIPLPKATFPRVMPYFPSSFEIFRKNKFLKEDSFPFSGHSSLVHLFKLFSLQGSTAMRQFHPSILLTGSKGTGKRTFIHQLCRRYGFHLTEINLYETLTESEALTMDNIEQLFKVANACSPCVLYFRNFDAISRENDNEMTSQKTSRKRNVDTLLEKIHKNASSPMIFIASVRMADQVSKDYKRLFNYIEDFNIFKDEDRVTLLENSFAEAGVLISMDAQLNTVVKEYFSGYSVHRILTFIRYCLQFMQNRLHQKQVGKHVLSMSVLNDVSRLIQNQVKKNAQQISIPKVSWGDVGGLEKAKKQILDTIQLPLLKPHLFSSGMKKRSGVLLYGPPGCGKTLIAKAVATECKLNFLSVKGPELISMYIGESERNIRELFSKARQHQPSIIFFDELDALAPNRGKSGDAGGLMDRIVSQLLSELDQEPGENNNVFIMGATNRVDLVDNSLLRSGRFDVCVEVGICEGEDRLKVVKALTRKFKLADDVNLEAIVSKCGEGMSGADFYALCSNAMLNCILRKCQQDEPSDSDIIVENNDFMEALKSVNASLTSDQVLSYKRLD